MTFVFSFFMQNIFWLFFEILVLPDTTARAHSLMQNHKPLEIGLAI